MMNFSEALESAQLPVQETFYVSQAVLMYRLNFFVSLKDNCFANKLEKPFCILPRYYPLTTCSNLHLYEYPLWSLRV